VTKAERAEASHENSGATFDVARIDPEGTSVFAGRAKPGASVTIMADGEAIGTTEADENGEWTFSVEHPFANADPKLALRAGPPLPKPEPEVARTAATGPAQAPIAAPPGERRSAVAVTNKLLKNLEGMVETARGEQAREPAAAAPAPLPESEPKRGSVTAARVSPQPAPPGAAEPARHKSVPVPITFVFNEATFTDNGRKAAGLLLEYLKLKRFPSVRLTGHADERGTEEFNLELSRERLDTVASFLRENGYSGQLELIPKGKAEPFAGVVRGEYDQEELWQLDRRVELIITQ
jgi:outer membrane protein OmpA-like peptidoglycan-associated protein